MSAAEVDLVHQQKDLELEKVDSEEEDFASLNSDEEYQKKEHVGTWVASQNDLHLHHPTPMNRVTADATTARLAFDKPPTETDKPKTVKGPYVHHRAATATYDPSSSEEDFAVNSPPPPSRQKEDNVTMRDLVTALSQFGGSTSQNQVLMKTTVDKDLPKFGGEPANWMQFKTEFDRTTAKYKFDTSENMIRLRKALVGQAKTTVQHLMVNVDNVEVIMDSLQKRFGRPRVVLNALATKAKACNNVTTAKPESIIEFGLAVQALVSNIVSFGEDGYLNSVELLETLVKKLSPDLATKWFEWLAADRSRDDNLLGFSEWSSAQLDIAYQRTDIKYEEPAEERQERRRKRGPGSINVSTSGEGGKKCACCGKGSHPLEKCWAFKKKDVNERWKTVKLVRACISCLKIGHRSKECDSVRECEVSGCRRLHHSLLHNDRFERESSPYKKEEKDDDSAELLQHEDGKVHLKGNIAVITGCDGPLPIIPVKLKGPAGVVKCYAMLDSGATRSLLKRSVAEKLGLEGEPITYSYRGISGKTVTEKEAARVNCDISGILRGNDYKKLRAAVTVQDIKMSPYSIDMDEIKKTWPHLKNVAAPSLHDVVPDIIIGNNNPHLILARKILQAGDEDPVGWRSELGWTVSGNFDSFGIGSLNLLCGEAEVTNDCLHHLIKQSFSFEDFGVKQVKAKGKNLDEKRAYKILERTSRKVGDRWQVGLLWSEDDVSFPESETAALKRLQYTERKMKDPLYKQMYMEKIREYLTKGYMRKLTTAEAAARRNNTYIIPHFGVTNPNKPGKFRFILDAKAKTHGVSLNDKLLNGPDLIRSLVGVLWNFRKHRIALTGDITDMFHRVEIRPEDRDSLKLLWRDGDSRKAVDHYQMNVMIFGATSSPATAIFVKNKNANLFKEKYPRAVDAICNDFYVDDALTGGNTVSEVIELRKQISFINASGNFTVCKWMSNSKDVIHSIPEDLRTEGAKHFSDKDDLPGERVLGMWWNSEEDVFQFKSGILDGEMPTKRQMCGLIMSLFDPVGFISHYKIKGLMLLQEVWNAGVGWDDEIPVATYSKWRKWLSRLEEVKFVKVPRCYSPLISSADDIQLHTFVDASSESYSSICYLRIQKGERVETALVGSKARVAPLKKATIPKLELQAALMGTRLAASIEEELKLKINSRYFWSDSSTVLQWLRSRAGKLKEFVANRIGEIQETTNPHEWHWIPTKMNIADIATRFESEISFDPDCEWYQGPSFLRGNPAEWNFAEKRKEKNELSGVVAVTQSSEKNVYSKQTSLVAATPPLERFSSYGRLLRATAVVLKAVKIFLSKLGKNENAAVSEKKIQPKLKFASPLTADDLVAAEKHLVKLAQEESFGNDLKILRDRGQLDIKSCIWRLSPILDVDGIVRVDGRIGAAKEISESVKFPIILPPRHRVTELIVDREHVRNAHQGSETVLSNLRQKFWLIDARHTVKRSWSRCQVCYLAKCKPQLPKMGNLPAFRLASHQPPFTFTGIDLFGPMEVTVGRHHEKRWGVLICCTVTRAVHLEIVHSLSTDEIMMALSRFIDMRGRPSVIHSDNGTNFVGAAKELKEMWSAIDFTRIQEHGRFQEIAWIFNPPAAPHMGGVWERLIQTVKKCLRAVLHEKYPKDTTLLTLFKSVENMMNSRPLTYSSCDPSDPEPITPNHILRGGCDAGPSVPAVLDSSDEFLRSQWKRRHVMADQFWTRWTKENLPKLLRRGKWQDPVEPLVVGSLVFMVDEPLPRSCWVRAYVSKVFPKNGQVRVVEVTTRDHATKKISTFRRPVTKLCPLGLVMEIKDPKDP